MYTKKLYYILILLMIQSLLGQNVTLDWKMQDVGQVNQVLFNNGSMWSLNTYDYPSMINCEFPPNSFEEHIGEGGLWVGAITPDNDTLVSVATSWAPWGVGEFWPPSDEPWDSIWVVNRGDTVDIPYWENYTALADKDYVFRYNDYNAVSLKDNNHTPLYIDVIEVSHNWSAPDILAQVILHDYYIIPKEFDLNDTYFTFWLDPNIGERSVDFFRMLVDDYSEYYPELHMGVGRDGEGGIDGDAISPVGLKIFPPDNISLSSLNWTFKWGGSANPPGVTPGTDVEKYQELMATRTIMENQSQATGSHFIISFGPIDIALGDTLKFQSALIFGYGIEGVISNAKALELIKEKGFNVPAPPPAPDLVVETNTNEVTLSWMPTELQNPEIYFDPNRADGDSLPFSGYRVYKSTQSITGPWKMLAEYDIEDDGYGYEIGLYHEYIDDGLLNNVQYYYTVTSFSKEDRELNWPSLECSKSTNASEVIPGYAAPDKVGQVAVVPNPYRGDVNYNAYNPPWEPTPTSRNFWMEQDRRIQFINLPSNCTIKIYTLTGRVVETLYHNVSDNKGYHDWNLTSSAGQAISSGIYVFSVVDNTNSDVQVGKFVVIK